MVSEKSTCFPFGKQVLLAFGGRVCGRGRGVSSVMCFAHDSSFCGRSRGGFRLCGGEAGAFRSPPPPLRSRTYKLVLCPTLAGRGGSVSRRDHNQATGNRVHLTGGTTYAEATPPNASCSSGEGVWGEALLSEKRPLPQNLSNHSLFGREREGGGFSARKAPSLARLITRQIRPSLGWRALGGDRPRSAFGGWRASDCR